jgi:hypothetical protein
MRDVDAPRAVLVLDGRQWFRGSLEAWDKRDDGAWWGFVRWSGYVQWSSGCTRTDSGQTETRRSRERA